LGIEDILLSRGDRYNTTSIVLSQEEGVELYRIDRDAFCNTLRVTPLWNDLINKSTHFVKVCHKGIKLMERSNR